MSKQSQQSQTQPQLDEAGTFLDEPVSVAKERLLEASEANEIAECLGLEPGEFADEVLRFARDPGASPQIQMMTEEDEVATGVPPPSEFLEWIDAVADGSVVLAATTGHKLEDGFSTHVEKREEPRRAPPVQPRTAIFGGQLTAELRRQQHQSRLQMEAARRNVPKSKSKSKSERRPRRLKKKLA